MKISKSMVHSSLRHLYWPLKMLAALLSKTWGLKIMHRMAKFSVGANIEHMHCEERYIPSQSNGPDIRARIFRPLDNFAKLPAMLYLHGGGYAMGCPEWAMNDIEKFIRARPCIVIAPDYRKSLEAPYPAAFNDAYDSLLWLKDNAVSLGAVANKFIVAGHSAGGSLAAAISLKARDTNDVCIAFQMPIYPMLDDRQQTKSYAQNNAPVWNAKTSALAWQLYLKGLKAQNAEIPPYAAPARTKDYSGLPPTISFVGDLEPFTDETIEYIMNLKEAGIPVEFELFCGCFHSFESFVPKTDIGERANQFLMDSFAKYIDKYYAQ